MRPCGLMIRAELQCRQVDGGVEITVSCKDTYGLISDAIYSGYACSVGR